MEGCFAVNFLLSSDTMIPLLLIAGGCVLLQRFFKNRLTRDQYFYMRDLSLLSTMLLLALWSGSERIEALVACAMLSMVVGLAERTRPGRGYFAMIILPGLIFALTGESISYVSSAGGSKAFVFFSAWQSVLLTTAWMTLFPVLFRRLDQVPGLAGRLLAVSLALMAGVSFFSRQNLSEAFLVSSVSLILVTAYWSRMGHCFRQLGEPLSSLWGTIVAGASIIGVSKGITLTALMVIPLGFYAVPLVEFSLGLVSHTVRGDKSPVRRDLYSRVIRRGVDHPAAVRLVTEICFIVGGAVTLMQVFPGSDSFHAVVPVMACVLLMVLWSLYGGGKDMAFRDRLWGVKIDGISMNYALSKSMSWIKNGSPEFRLIVTLNALGMMCARENKEFREVVDSAALVLPDGAGLVWGLRKLGIQVVERVAGIDYMERLCRLAATESIPVFFLGARPGVANAAAEHLKEQYDGLNVVGTYDGYFDRAFSHEVASKVRDSGARILFAGFGQPAQELWLSAMKEELDGILCVGVGGSFDVFAGRVKRAPRIWQKIGCEWLYRLLREPWRLKRDLQLGVFVVDVLRERFNIFHTER